MDRPSRFPRHLAAACAALPLLVGCLAVRTPEAGAPARVAAGEGIVLGRVRVLELGRELTPWKREVSEILAEDPVVRLALFQVESGRKRPDVPLDDDGRFEWILPAGIYLLYHTPSIDPPINEPLAAFQVPPDAPPLDLGELLLDVSVERPLGLEQASYAVLRVDARGSDPATAGWFLARHPGTPCVGAGAFVTDPALGSLFESWSRDACARILARHGLAVGDAAPGPDALSR